jgi:hypothetical protein
MILKGVALYKGQLDWHPGDHGDLQGFKHEENMNKLRLLVTERCSRNCPNCCNKNWDLSELPVEDDFSQYDMIMLTGGEPMLDVKDLIDLIINIKYETDAPIYVYTAMVNDTKAAFRVLDWADGMTVTLHEQSDMEPFLIFNDVINAEGMNNKSLRLNIFSGVDIDISGLALWEVKNNIEWIENCPLPKDEVFKRI